MVLQSLQLQIHLEMRVMMGFCVSISASIIFTIPSSSNCICIKPFASKSIHQCAISRLRAIFLCVPNKILTGSHL